MSKHENTGSGIDENAPSRPDPEEVHPFPNMPGFVAEKYQGEIPGYQFFSMCSRHHEHDDQCNACQVGGYAFPERKS